MAEEGKPKVHEYMTRDVSTVSLDDTVEDVIARINESDDHSGFPVTDGRHVKGFISARDLLVADDHDQMFRVMSDDILVAHPDMAVQDAARVILRSGIQKLPVVDDAGHLVGIISNADVIRSQIERATPSKVEKLKQTLEEIHNVSARDERREVDIDALTPTQDTVYADELEGRIYELRRGLAEPLVVIDNGSTVGHNQSTVEQFTDVPEEADTGLLLADGHHRAKAAERLDIEEMDAYVIVLDQPVELGMAETAAESDLEQIPDIDVVDFAAHPLVQTTKRLQDDEEIDAGS
jgi:IMP dehydrogenase